MIVSVIAAAVESVAVAVQRRRRSQPVLSREHVRHPVLAYAAFLVGLAAATVLASLGLYQVTHHWAGPQRAGTTELTVQVSVKDRALRTASMVEAAGRYCALTAARGRTTSRSSGSPGTLPCSISPRRWTKPLRTGTSAVSRTPSSTEPSSRPASAAPLSGSWWIRDEFRGVLRSYLVNQAHGRCP